MDVGSITGDEPCTADESGRPLVMSGPDCTTGPAGTLPLVITAWTGACFVLGTTRLYPGPKEAGVTKVLPCSSELSTETFFHGLLTPNRCSKASAAAADMVLSDPPS